MPKSCVSLALPRDRDEASQVRRRLSYDDSIWASAESRCGGSSVAAVAAGSRSSGHIDADCLIAGKLVVRIIDYPYLYQRVRSLAVWFIDSLASPVSRRCACAETASAMVPAPVKHAQESERRYVF